MMEDGIAGVDFIHKLKKVREFMPDKNMIDTNTTITDRLIDFLSKCCECSPSELCGDTDITAHPISRIV